MIITARGKTAAIKMELSFYTLFLSLFGIGSALFVVYIFMILAGRYYINGGLYRRYCTHIKVKLHGKTAIVTGEQEKLNLFLEVFLLSDISKILTAISRINELPPGMFALI